MYDRLTPDRESAQVGRQEPPDGGEPLISVVVACRNEVSGIEACVESLLGQDSMMGGLEILVVDGMSSDGSREILQRLARTEPQLRIIDNVELIAPIAVNLGIQAARGQYVAIVSAHGRYASNYLAMCLQVAMETGADNVGGGVDVEGDSLISHAIQLVHNSRLSVGGAAWHNRGYEGYAETVFGGFYKKEVFERIGWFDPGLVRNADDEFNLRLRQSEGTVYCSPKIRSSYSPRRKLSEVFAQYAQYGYWRIAVIRKHGRPSSFRQVVPAACMFSFTLLILGAILWPWTLLIAAGTGVSYLVFVSVISWRLTAGAVAGKLAAPLDVSLVGTVIAVFLCFHLGYGLGSTVGIFDLLVGRHGRPNRFRQLTRS